MENGGPLYTPILPTLADGLAVPTVGYNAYATAKPLVDKMIVVRISLFHLEKDRFYEWVFLIWLKVREEWIALAILRLVELEKCVVEGAGGAGLAAIMAGHLDEFKGKK